MSSTPVRYIPMHAAYPRDDSPGRDAVAFVQIPASKWGEFEKGRARVQEAIDSLARCKFSAAHVSLECFSTAAQLNEVGSFPELCYESGHLRRISLERREGGADSSARTMGTHLLCLPHLVVVTPAVDSRFQYSDWLDGRAVRSWERSSWNLPWRMRKARSYKVR